MSTVMTQPHREVAPSNGSGLGVGPKLELPRFTGIEIVPVGLRLA